jgi:hypothetical protein
MSIGLRDYGDVDLFRGLGESQEKGQHIVEDKGLEYYIKNLWLDEEVVVGSTTG